MSPPLNQSPLDIVKVYPISVISQCIKDKRVGAYEKVLDESPTTQGQSFKIEGLTLAREAVPEVKKNLYNKTSCMNPLTKRERK